MKIKQCWGRNIYYQQVRNCRQGKRKEWVMLSHCTNINISVQTEKRKEKKRSGYTVVKPSEGRPVYSTQSKHWFGPKEKFTHPNITGKRNPTTTKWLTVLKPGVQKYDLTDSTQSCTVKWMQEALGIQLKVMFSSSMWPLQVIVSSASCWLLRVYCIKGSVHPYSG